MGAQELAALVDEWWQARMDEDGDLDSGPVTGSTQTGSYPPSSLPRGRAARHSTPPDAGAAA